MTQELVVSVGADGRDAGTRLDYWTACDVGLAHGGKVGLKWWLENPLELHSYTRARMLPTREPLG